VRGLNRIWPPWQCHSPTIDRLAAGPAKQAWRGHGLSCLKAGPRFHSNYHAGSPTDRRDRSAVAIVIATSATPRCNRKWEGAGHCLRSLPTFQQAESALSRRGADYAGLYCARGKEPPRDPMSHLGGQHASMGRRTCHGATMVWRRAFPSNSVEHCRQSFIYASAHGVAVDAILWAGPTTIRVGARPVRRKGQPGDSKSGAH
jgi:hypothetical protein